jgi:hypothetical protein
MKFANLALAVLFLAPASQQIPPPGLLLIIFRSPRGSNRKRQPTWKQIPICQLPPFPWLSAPDANQHLQARLQHRHGARQADDASLSATGTYTVTSDATVIVSSLTTATGATLNIAAKNFIINPVSGTELGVNVGTIRVANGAGFQLGGDGTSFDNTGTISLNSTGKATTLVTGANFRAEGESESEKCDSSYE